MLHLTAAQGEAERIAWLREAKRNVFSDLRLGHLWGIEEAQVRAMCDKLLANPIIEDFTFEVTHHP